jgi:hypothetical protein
MGGGGELWTMGCLSGSGGFMRRPYMMAAVAPPRRSDAFDASQSDTIGTVYTRAGSMLQGYLTREEWHATRV